MATRIKSPVHRRTSLPLTEINESDLSTLLSSSAYQEALEKLSGMKIVVKDASVSALLHAIFEIGMSAVKEKAELEGYAQIAASQSKSDFQKERRDSRRRRPTWADEE